MVLTDFFFLGGNLFFFLLTIIKSPGMIILLDKSLLGDLKGDIFQGKCSKRTFKYF